MMAWDVEFTAEFHTWWATLTETEQEDVASYLERLEVRGPNLPHPYSSGIRASRHNHMRELRVQSDGDPLGVFYAFDPTRTAILLIGGEKTGNDRFYDQMIPIADDLYDQHIDDLKTEAQAKK